MANVEKDQFYLVWRSGGANPTKRHETDGDAMNEAARLARANPGVRFYVLTAERYCEVAETPVTWQTLDPPVPF
jgi:hypothetical protein